MRIRVGGRPLTLLVGTALFGFAACDSGPEGPGAFTGTLDQSTTAVGAVVMEVSGAGIEGFSPLGATRLYHHRMEEENIYRVVLVNTAPGPLVFRVDVRDLSSVPQALVLEAADEENRILTSTASLAVRFAR